MDRMIGDLKTGIILAISKVELKHRAQFDIRNPNAANNAKLWDEVKKAILDVLAQPDHPHYRK